MIPDRFEYHAPASVDDAIALLQTHRDDAKLLAGGHSLLPLMKLRLASVSHLVDLGRIEGLSSVRKVDGAISIGAMTTHAELAESKLLRDEQPLVPRAAIQIADVQVRNRGTIGGSLAHADPASDLAAVILALDAELVIRGPDGNRRVPAGDFVESMFTSVLADNEILLEIRVPAASAGSRCTYAKVPHPASHLPIVGVAAQIELGRRNECASARLALTGLAPVAYRASAAEELLRGQALSESTIATAAARVTDGVEPLSDPFASGDYRLHLARVHTARALTSLAGS